MSAELSTGESAIYDRQIRLWGSSAQMRIKSGTVLVRGVSATTAEICKNVVLAGSNLVIVDDRLVDSTTINFLITLEADYIKLHEGMTVGEATALACRRLNEHPSVKWASQVDLISRVASCDAAVCSFPVVDFHTIRSVANQVRQKGKSFFCIVESSTCSWAFSDFGASHTVESHTAPLKRDERTGDRKSDNRVLEYAFSSFEEWLSAGFESNMMISKPYFPFNEVLFVRLLMEFHAREDGASAPSPKRSRKSDSTKTSFRSFVETRLTELEKSSPKLGKIIQPNISSLIELLDQMERSISIPALPHMAAIHGALISQEIVKFVTKRDVPLVNQIVLNPSDCGAIVLKTPMSLSSRVVAGGHDSEDDIELVNGQMTEQVLE